jgi:hypothetical protein
MPFPTELHFIEAAERRLRAKLPGAFRDHLLRSNGGEVEVLDLSWELNPVHDFSDRERSRRTAIDIVHVTEDARKWPDFPKGAVAVGDDGCGNYLVFLPIDQSAVQLAPKLYVWWHEGGELEAVGEDFNEAIAAG